MMRIVTGKQAIPKAEEDCFWWPVFFCLMELISHGRKGLYLRKRGMALKIVKVLNNNVVISLNKKGEDIIVMGSGIAFQKKRGDTIEEEKIERIFSQQVPDLAAKFQKILSEIPEEYQELTEEIIENARGKLEHDFDDNIYLSLMDHIHFSVQRYREGMLIKNQLLTETKVMYRKEYEAAQEALELINETFEVELPEDEAGFIAFHFVNASMSGSMEDTVQRTRIVQDTLMIIRNYFKMEFEEDSLDYYRLVTHLKFFVQRMMDKKPLTSTDGDRQLLELVESNYKRSYECVQRIAKYIHLEFGYCVSDEEKLYLTIHIERVRDHNA